ncbi:hypothetical protein H6785_03265 [Candidatus Nomurabacteria bacterium]|nr:hypothetical protein [Candidatus Kaiserbacteria bacterium]MCB9815567.1 hypothetical protein [Candidatus Nomurabacteria bacterium]
MSLFGLSKAKTRYGVIIDIGSGSVLASIVHSDPNKLHPDILWSHREHVPLKNISSMEQSAKAIMTALVNASMQLDAEGRKHLYDFDSKAELGEFQCGISAPWSYTITKSINYTQENDFEITNELIAQLYSAIGDKIKNDINQDEVLSALGLKVITRLLMDLTANGYHINQPEGNRSNTLGISQGTAVAQQHLIDAMDEIHDKLFAKADNRRLSFILMLYTMTKELLNQNYDVCLVDVTYEATEIGVVRDGILTYCTHTPFGSFSLAREIAQIVKIPLHEAFGYLHTEKPFAFLASLNEKQKVDVELVFEAYIEKITELFKETGDSLSIPKRISLHTDIKSEPLFTDLIGKAVTRNLKTSPIITTISSKIIDLCYKDQTENSSQKNVPPDTALLLSAQFFHNKDQYDTYEYF